MYVKFCNFGNFADEKALAASKQQTSTESTDVYKKVTLYRRLCFVLLLLCVALLAVVLAMAVKLSEAQSTQPCPTEAVESRTTDVCTRQVCENLFPPKHPQNGSGHGCSECGKGWLKFEDSCYLLSQKRLSWQESREECQQLGGDLVIIQNDRLQRYLTQKGLMMYWIGLTRSETQEWTWINNTALTKGYWSSNPQEGNCVFLNAGKFPRNNWISNPCTVYSHYICQRG